MTMPMRKNMPEGGLSTADLAQSRTSCASEAQKTKPFLTDSHHETELAESTAARCCKQRCHSLFPNNEMADLRNRWKEVQTAFVDEPAEPSSRPMAWSPRQ